MKGNDILRYNSARLFAASRTVPDQIQAISLIQDFSFGFNIQREEIKSVGYEEILKPVISNQRPYLSFSYFLSDVDNEKLFRMPVTSEAAILDKIPLFSGLESFDLFFLSNTEGQDFKDFTPEGELSACAFINANLTSYSFDILASGLIKVNVSFEAEDVLYDTFENISDYSYLDYDREDLQITNRNIFQINDGQREINLGIGGFETQGRVQSFSFSADISRKVLYDFGQHAHQREIMFPVEASISLDAFVSNQISGRLKNILCENHSTDFLISNSRATCENPNIDDDKSGMAFLGSRLVSQQYETSVSKGDYLTTSLNFSLDIPKVFTGKAGAFISQHITQLDGIVTSEDSEPDGAGGRRSKTGTGNVLDILLEDGSGGKLLLEVAKDMIEQLRDLQGG